jgi:hypothetical protein
MLLHAIVATSLRFCADARLTLSLRAHYHDTSKALVLLYGLENSTVEALQALVILSLDVVGTGNGPPAWNLLALITRSVVQLGLSVESDSLSVVPRVPSIYTLRAMVLPEAKTWVEDESRRRLFWMVYLLDRYTTLATAFEFGVQDGEIDRRLPCRDSLWSAEEFIETRKFAAKSDEKREQTSSKPDCLGAFAYYIEILGLLSRIHNFLKKPMDITKLSDVEAWQHEYLTLDAVLTTWKFDLPSDYGSMTRLFQSSGKAINSTWIMLHATFHTAVIRLHSSAAYPTTRSHIFTPSYSASQRCLRAVENIAALTQYVLQNNMLDKLGPPFAFTLWVAARLLLVHGCTVEHKVSDEIESFVSTLRDMGRSWGVAERYSDILQRVLDEHRDSEQVAISGSEGHVTPSSVKILADMRRCAFDLDFLISRQPRIKPMRKPAANELEYLDIFELFNFPRSLQSQEAERLARVDDMPRGLEDTVNGASQFNITNFIVDANSDWLFRDQS